VVADTLRSGASSEGLRPIHLARDWRAVLALIEQAFGEELDLEARRSLDNMRLPRLLAPLMGVLDSLSPPGEGMMPGFVWVRGGRVVGAASVRHISAYSRGWLVSNVAVHPDWQGHGIGRALLEAAIDFAGRHRGGWVVLQVREDNRTARQLYASLGFRTVGEIVRWRRASFSELRASSVLPSLRPAAWLDGGALARLAQTLVPHDVLWADLMNRRLYRTGPLDRWMNQLEGRWLEWWVQDDLGHALKAAVGVQIDRQLPWRRLRLLIPPQRQDEQLAAALIQYGLHRLAQTGQGRLLPVEIEHPASDQATRSALAESGFDPVYSLIHLRLDLE
jgi:ribosomal protein S18 acetylase RimI-like enzyme